MNWGSTEGSAADSNSRRRRPSARRLLRRSRNVSPSSSATGPVAGVGVLAGATASARTATVHLADRHQSKTPEASPTKSNRVIPVIRNSSLTAGQNSAGRYGRPMDRVVTDHRIMDGVAPAYAAPGSRSRPSWDYSVKDSHPRTCRPTDHPHLVLEDVLACLQYAAGAVNERILPLQHPDPPAVSPGVPGTASSASRYPTSPMCHAVPAGTAAPRAHDRTAHTNRCGALCAPRCKDTAPNQLSQNCRCCRHRRGHEGSAPAVARTLIDRPA